MAKLKDNVVLRPFGLNSCIDNSNITNDIAKWLLDNGKAKKEDFEILPKQEEKEKKTNTKNKNK